MTSQSTCHFFSHNLQFFHGMFYRVDDVGLQHTNVNESESHQDSKQGKRNTKFVAHKSSVYVKKSRAPTPEDDDDA